jgi:hypothetical protein
MINPMPIPSADLARIDLWCLERVPEHLRDRLRVEADVTPRHVTIVEVQPPWDGQGEWTRSPVVRLHYTASTERWTLFWRDQDLEFHAYPRSGPVKTVGTLLGHIARDEDGIFWG